MKLLKWPGVVLAGILVLLILTAGILYGLGWSKLNRVYSIPSSTLTIPTDAASIERGRHLVQEVSLCGSGHGLRPIRYPMRGSEKFGERN